MIFTSSSRIVGHCQRFIRRATRRPSLEYATDQCCLVTWAARREIKGMGHLPRSFLIPNFNQTIVTQSRKLITKCSRVQRTRIVLVSRAAFDLGRHTVDLQYLSSQVSIIVRCSSGHRGSSWDTFVCCNYAVGANRPPPFHPCQFPLVVDCILCGILLDVCILPSLSSIQAHFDQNICRRAVEVQHAFTTLCRTSVTCLGHCSVVSDPAWTRTSSTYSISRAVTSYCALHVQVWLGLRSAFQDIRSLKRYKTSILTFVRYSELVIIPTHQSSIRRCMRHIYRSFFSLYGRLL